MSIEQYALEVIGQCLQILPALMLYFLCIPVEMFRMNREKTIVLFHSAAIAESFFHVIIKYTIAQRQAIWNLYESGRVLLILEILLFIVIVSGVVRTPRIRNMMTVVLVFFWINMQNMLTDIIVRDRGVFSGRLVRAYAVVTVFTFPVMVHLFARYVREYMQMSGVHYLRMVFGIALVLFLITFAHVMAASWMFEADMIPVSAAMSVSLLFTYWLFLRFVVIMEREEKLQRHILASQIQPHFIYNTMNTIYGLCDVDVEEAKQAICDFSDYLRSNFESQNRTEPVSFQKELEHAVFYLSIEKRRFRDDLRVEIETPVTSFMLPPLTIQPLVENAVRHGIRQKMQPGTVAIRTRETETAYEVVIEDDGAGFNTQAVSTDDADRNPDKETVLQEDHIHIGISNTRARIEHISNGTLSVESKVGLGTIVTIRIPK